MKRARYASKLCRKCAAPFTPTTGRALYCCAACRPRLASERKPARSPALQFGRTRLAERPPLAPARQADLFDVLVRGQMELEADVVGLAARVDRLEAKGRGGARAAAVGATEEDGDDSDPGND
jgi:hypothetical protein